MSKPRQTIAIFDFDGTITFADSFLPFLRHTSGFIRFGWNLLLLSPAFARHLLGGMDNAALKERFLNRFLAGRAPDELQSSIQSFLSSRLPILMNPTAVGKMEWHRREGHRLILLSASPELYLRPWGDETGFDTIIATRLETKDGRLTGRLDGRNCHGSEKLERLKAAVGDLERIEIYSYGDSRSDLPVLDIAEHAGFCSFHGRPRWRHRLKSLARFVRALL